MPKISDNGFIREMTAEEIESLSALIVEQKPTAEERLSALENAFIALLEGKTE